MDNGTVVFSKSGHDKGRFYMVVNVEGGCAWIADGKERRLSKPKRKNPKHLAKTNTVIDMKEVTSDKKLRALLKPFNGPEEANGNGGRPGFV